MRWTVTDGSKLYNVRDYGAVGNDATDDWTAITAAFTAAAAVKGKVYFPAGNYRVSKPIVFAASFFGEDRQNTAIKCLNTGFTGNMLVDFNNDALQKTVRDLTFDARGLSGVQIFGSTGDASGSSLSRFDSLSFNNTAAGVYAVGGQSTTNVGGMLTGSVFTHCIWQSCAQPLNVGQNQDDVVLIGSRFMQVSWNIASDIPIRLMSQNCQMYSTYLYVATTSVTGIAPIIGFGSVPVKISGLFVEAVADCNYTHLFRQVNPNVCASVDTVRFGTGTMAAWAGLVSVQLGPTTAPWSVIDIRNVQNKTTSNGTVLFEVDATATSAASGMTLRWGGCDQFVTPFALRSGSTSSAAKVALHGLHGTTYYGGTTTPAAFGTLTPFTQAAG